MMEPDIQQPTQFQPMHDVPLYSPAKEQTDNPVTPAQTTEQIRTSSEATQETTSQNESAGPDASSQASEVVKKEGDTESPATAPNVPVVSPVVQIIPETRATKLFKTTQQSIKEIFGRGNRTIDPMLLSRVGAVRESHKKCRNFLWIARNMATNLERVLQTQRHMQLNLSLLKDECLTEFASERSAELRWKMHKSETSWPIIQNGQRLLDAIRQCMSTFQTFCDTTVDDVFKSVKQYESARLEYDAHTGPGSIPIQSAEYKRRLDQLREALCVKMDFLEENKLNEVYKKLLQLHNDVTEYFTSSIPANLPCEPSTDEATGQATPATELESAKS